ncbi:hypothetical protein A3C89_02290 [Candidatus Kaiserbacteria bacterium RIFCSPHIGHO2_02_FULL_50_50]|uniref:Ribonuclease P protein component n=1 Tax=Candidatus Kaiserbacteria bacterium RIFCSPHIGHO2_02_FULL_50_50 TaxID=1798492 RepID=A0A1F6DFJ3_9BACT|nr:MAG: hypothetical protein A3C89_02290 [Candidatus Kaiserbacteria bacterium RIFCSPHIGHO2_02_FULL_50_50]OGG88627.1 MAG: hypothetical protein A3G62_00835 [Candidatus Kaiserbacteria bacterium RIFCSPLOWO2_12_FULL_50_10]
MLAKQNRLTTHEFNTAFKNGRRFHGELATMLYMPSTTVKAAVVVSGKTTNIKPVRNKLRRQVYEIVRASQKVAPRTGTYIFLLKKEALRANYATLSQSITKLLAKQLNT